MGKQELILLALNPSATLQLLERALRAADYSVAIAQNTESLEKALIESNPALVLIGEDLRGISGLEISIRMLERFPTLPIVLFADRDDPALMKQCLKAGLSDYIHPPLKIDDIVHAIRRSQQRASSMGDWVRREVKRSTQSLEKRVNELEALMQVTRQIGGSLDIDNVLTSMVSAAVSLTGAEEGNILLLDEQTGDLIMRASRTFEDQTARTFNIPVKDTLAGQVIRTGQPVAFSENAPLKIKTAYLVYSLIYAPLRVQDRVIGVLSVVNRRSQRPFITQHEMIINILSDYAAIGIDNARLYASSEAGRIKLETTITGIADGVILLDQQNRILLINPVARTAFGLGITDLEGKPASEVILHADFKSLLDTAEENPFKSHEVSFEDGRVFNAQYTPINDVGAAITLQEITHLKMLDRIKSDFINTISHDLRSPLTSIMGYVELLDRVGDLNDQQKKFIQHIRASIQSITALVNDLLDLGRIEAGFDSRKDDVAFDTVVRYALDNFQNQISDKRQTLYVEIAERLPTLRGNPIRLRQLADNLIGNAVKYTPEGGDLSVSLQADNSQIVFEIKDSGVGIPAADQPHIFEKFYRANNAPKNTPGTGLGLAIVKSIVDNHEGRIWVDSSPGTGTKFTVILPTYPNGEA
jgi:two-component system NtrC family sensor kinase